MTAVERRKAGAPPPGSAPIRDRDECSARRIRWQALLSAAGRKPVVRLSALRLPFFEGGFGKGFLAVAWQSSDAKPHREKEEACIRPRDSGGGGPCERKRSMVEGASDS